MNCPVCKTTELKMADRSGIEIDYCPECRGVWLDRGELDKIIDRTASQMASGPPPPPAQARPHEPQMQPPPQPQRGYVPDPDSDYDYRGHGKPYRKRKSILGEIFDF